MTHARWRPIPLTRQVLADFRRGWRPLVAYDIVCKFLTTAALAPLLAAFLNLLISSSGDPAVSNYDLIAFFLHVPYSISEGADSV